MEPHDAYEGRDGFNFLDVRTELEWDAGHVENAVHITLSEIPQRFDELDRDRPLVCVCQIGQRSALAARFLKERGFDAHNLEGGLTRWVAEGLPLSDSRTGSGKVIDGKAEYLEW